MSMPTLYQEELDTCNAASNQEKISWFCHFFLPFLILLTPFLHFLSYHAYCITCPETGVIISGLAILASVGSFIFIKGWTRLYIFFIAILTTIFIDIQFRWIDNLYEAIGALVFFSALAWGLKNNFALIATVVFGTFIAVTFATLNPHSIDKYIFATTPSPAPHSETPPRLIHIILDEHIGIEGIPTGIPGGHALQDNLIDFYRSYGFQLSSNAFSHYFLTSHSIPSLMNFSNERDQQVNIDLDHQKGEHHKLLHNTYFESLDRAGYQINVLAPQYIDYCLHSRIEIQNCNQYNSFTMNVLQDLDIPISQKVNLLVSGYLKKSYIKNQVVKKAYLFFQISGTHIIGTSLPPWSWENSPSSLRMHSLHTLNQLKTLGDNIMATPPGNALIVHLLFPHYPYITDAKCSVRNPKDWKSKNTRMGGNTAESRDTHYQLYFEQISCLYLKLDGIFKHMQSAKIYDDSIIILHGDHGSRISIRDPLVKHRDVLTEEDITDHFSTLFAVKMPGKPWSYDSTPQPLEQLLSNVTTDITGVSSTIVQNQPENFVYLEDKKQLVPIPYPMSH